MNLSSPFYYLVDPVLRAPTIGCMLMCLAAALVGVVIYLKKQSLVGESLSHASYPGVILGVIVAGIVLPVGSEESGAIAVMILVGAYCSALLGLWMIHFMENKLKVRSDAALCFILSTFFGLGLTLASQVQFSYTTLYKQAQAYLYGQAATMTDLHIVIYGVLAFCVIFMVVFLQKEFKTITFDREYAKSLGIKVSHIDAVFFAIVVLAVVIGIRSVGVVLMSAMLIAPAVAARQFTNRLSMMFILAAIFGLISGFFGNYLSVELTLHFSRADPSSRLAFPTGPMIVVTATTLFLVALLFAPARGLLLRLLRITRFRYQCMCENILKTIWRAGPQAEVSLSYVAKYQHASRLYLRFILWRLLWSGWITKRRRTRTEYSLTHEGYLFATKIVRLHRLWEVYLANYVGIGAERVHRNAEEMEHIITPELEEELVLLLHNPQEDPHHQLIPPKGES